MSQYQTLVPIYGESIYSILSRLHVVEGNASPLFTLNRWTGVRGYKPQSGLPTHLNALANNLNLPDGPIRLISAHSHFPLYAHFINEERRQLLIEAMLKAGSPKSRIGLLRNDMGACDIGRYCPGCQCSDIEHYGVALWHREHSMPGIKVCASHEGPLHELQADQKFGDRQLVLAGLSMTSIPLIPPSAQDKFLYISRQVMYLIGHAAGNVIDSSVYKRLLRESGHVTKYGRVRQRPIVKAVETWLKGLAAFQGYDRIYNGLKIERNWVAELVAGDNNFHHPIKHIILWGSLGWEAKNVIDTCSSAWNQMELSFEFSRPIDITREVIEESLSLTGSYRQAAIALGIDANTLMVKAESLGFDVKRRPKKISEETRLSILSDASMFSTSVLSRKYNLSISTINRVRRGSH